LSESKWSFCISLIAKMGDGLPNTAFLFQNSAFRFGNTGNKEEEELLKKLETGLAAPVPEVQKKANRRRAFQPELFCEKNGLKLLTTELTKVKFKLKKGHEISNLKRLMRRYKEWSNNLYPQRFEAAIIKFEKLSGKIIIQKHLQKLRDQRDGIQPDEPLVHSDDDIMQEIERKGGSASKPAPFAPFEDDMPPPDVLSQMMDGPPDLFGSGPAAFSSGPAAFSSSKPASFGAKKTMLFGAKKVPFGAKKSGGFAFGAKKKPLLFGGQKADPKPVEQGAPPEDDLDALLADIESSKQAEAPDFEDAFPDELF